MLPPLLGHSGEGAVRVLSVRIQGPGRKGPKRPAKRHHNDGILKLTGPSEIPTSILFQMSERGDSEQGGGESQPGPEVCRPEPLAQHEASKCWELLRLIYDCPDRRPPSACIWGNRFPGIPGVGSSHRPVHEALGCCSTYPLPWTPRPGCGGWVRAGFPASPAPCSPSGPVCRENSQIISI